MRVARAIASSTAVTTIWGLQRQRLHGVLRAAAEAADDVELVAGAEVLSVRPGLPGAERAAVTWRTGDAEQTAESALIVAADGVRSAVRARLFPGVPARYSGSTSWRAIIPDTESEDRLVQAWGPGTEFGSLRVSPTEIYWYGYFRNPEGAVFDDELAAAGADATIHQVEGAHHGFDTPATAWPDAEQAMFGWLTAHGIGK